MSNVYIYTFINIEFESDRMSKQETFLNLLDSNIYYSMGLCININFYNYTYNC